MQSFVTYLEKSVPQTQRQKFIEEVAHNTPDIIYVLDLEERKIIFINDRVKSILGYEPEDIYKLGSKIFVKKLHPDDYLRRMQHITACREMKEDEAKTIDVRLRAKDETWRWFRIRDIAFKLDNGKAIQTIGIARDIHDLKLAENEIRRKETLLSTAINLIPDLLQAFKAIRNDKGEIEDFEWIMINEAASAFTNEAIGKRLIQQYPGVVPSGLFDIYRQVVETGKSITTEVFYNYDNFKRWAKLFVAKMGDGFMVLSYDLNEKNKIEQEAEKRGIKKGKQEAAIEFEKLSAIGMDSRTIAHEIRNPLTNINLSVQILKREVGETLMNSDKLNECAEVISRNCKRIEHLLKELLYRSLPAEYNLLPTSLNELIEETMAVASDRILLKEIIVEENIESGCFINAEPEKMKIALLNIIINAVEAMEYNEGKLEIVARKEDGKIQLSVEDNGCGIGKAELEKIFEPDYSTKSYGLGIGLSNVKTILEKHGATYIVASEVNKGTKFTIYFDLLNG